MRDEHTYRGRPVREMTDHEIAVCLESGICIVSGLEEEGCSESHALESMYIRLDVERIRRSLGIPLLR